MKIAQYLKMIALIGALALLAGQARADSVSTEFGPLYYPDGATVTSVTLNLPPEYQEAEVLDYTFADGTGWLADPIVDGDVGQVNFSTPITALTFDYVWDGSTPFDVTFYTGDSSQTYTLGANGGTASFTFDGNVTEMWFIGQNEIEGWGGVTSLSYTLDGPVSTPEPSTWLLLALGLALVGVAFAWRGIGERSERGRF
jgi:PEP-CTERM motif